MDFGNMDGIRYRLINVYGHPSSGKERELEDITPYLLTSQTVIFGGDFNSHIQIQESMCSEEDQKGYQWFKAADVKQ